MWPVWVSNPGPLPLESDALPTAIRVPAVCVCVCVCVYVCVCVCARERRGAYTVMSRWEILLLKNHSHFSWVKNYYMYGEKLPYLSSD